MKFKNFMGSLLLLSVQCLFFVCAQATLASAQDKSVGSKIMARVAEVKEEVTAVSVEQLQAMMTAGETFHMIDVREADEFQAGHIKGAQLFPRGTIEFDAAKGKLGPTDQKYILYCKRDARGALAAKALEEIGYTDISYITGGFEAWVEAGNPIFNQHGEVTVKEFEKPEAESK